MANSQSLRPDAIYHLFTKGLDEEHVFQTDRDYLDFLDFYVRHLDPVAELLAYCLVPTHFHLLVRIRTDEERAAQGQGNRSPDRQPESPSRQISKLLGVYTRAFNKRHDRSGSLFVLPAGHIPVVSVNNLKDIVAYIHQNPRKHNFSEGYRNWHFSSYRTILGEHSTRVNRDLVLSWFNHSRSQFEAYHDVMQPSMPIQPLMLMQFSDL